MEQRDKVREGVDRMPTGYTAAIKEGITFEQYAMGCARAFGACIMMRDAPDDATIPEEFQPSDYHAKAIKEAIAEGVRLLAMTEEEKEKAALEEYTAEAERVAKAILDNADVIAKYNAMLEQVKKWHPPTPEHTEFKTFMQSRIEESIRFDGMQDYYKDHPAVQLSGVNWCIKELEEITRSLRCNTEENAKEIERAEGRTSWVKALRDSLAQ